MIIEHNGVYFGTANLPNRKKWALIIGGASTAKAVAYFSNNDRRREFEKAMLKFFDWAKVHDDTDEGDSTAERLGDDGEE